MASACRQDGITGIGLVLPLRITKIPENCMGKNKNNEKNSFYDFRPKGKKK